MFIIRGDSPYLHSMQSISKKLMKLKTQLLYQIKNLKQNAFRVILEVLRTSLKSFETPSLFCSPPMLTHSPHPDAIPHTLPQTPHPRSCRWATSFPGSTPLSRWRLGSGWKMRQANSLKAMKANRDSNDKRKKKQEALILKTLIILTPPPLKVWFPTDSSPKANPQTNHSTRRLKSAFVKVICFK